MPSRSNEMPGSQQPSAQLIGRSKKDQLHHIAALVARGEMPLPTDFSMEELQIVLCEVAQRRRAGIVKFIARAIAADIQSERKP